MYKQNRLAISLISILGLISLASNAYADNLIEPDKATLAKAMSKHLEKQGDFCLGKFDWPIAVSDKDAQKPTRDAVQMPVLEKLGLVESSNAIIKHKIDDSEEEESLPGKSYALSETGKKFYLQKELLSAGSSGEKIIHRGDFCAGKFSLDKIVKWDKPSQVGDHYETTVTYTYKIAAADWTHDPDIERVFPMVDHIVKGQGNMPLQQHFRFVDQSWVAIDPWE